MCRPGVLSGSAWAWEPAATSTLGRSLRRPAAPIGAVGILALDGVVGYATYRWRRVERVVQGKPIRIITDGRVHVGAMKRELLTLNELRSALRKQGVVRIADCRQVVLEPDGTLSIVRQDVEPHSLMELAHPEDIYSPEGGGGI